MLLAKEQTVLQSMIERVTETGRCCGMEMNVVKTEVIETSSQIYVIQILIDH